ncbi:peptidylprolyl isomerase [bacterium]|nr:peptidylprolyl isomerase [bacterium]
MQQAKNGDRVKVHYLGKLDDGTVFDSSEGREPLEFTLGENMLIPGFEEAVIGMAPGESKETRIESMNAYGAYHENMVVQIDRGQFPDELKPAIGQMLQIRGNDGEPVVVSVIGMDDDFVTLDANHPLAGKDLNFTIRLVEIA